MRCREDVWMCMCGSVCVVLILLLLLLLLLILLLSLLLAGPALFRGRLRAFGKCTNGVALSKGRPNLASVRLTL